ncbi:MAG: hypothetical protein LH679_05120, partial [Cyanobacteria bacterium CAN_BIN43]|nr:hypothetical protein [Cyanobacteria bacterium CAN_BIN43]
MTDFQAGSGDVSSQRSGQNSTKTTHNDMSGNTDPNGNHSKIPILPMLDSDRVEPRRVVPRRRDRRKFSIPKVPMPKRWWSWALLMV